MFYRYRILVKVHFSVFIISMIFMITAMNPASIYKLNYLHQSHFRLARILFVNPARIQPTRKTHAMGVIYDANYKLFPSIQLLF